MRLRSVIRILGTLRYDLKDVHPAIAMREIILFVPRKAHRGGVVRVMDYFGSAIVFVSQCGTCTDGCAYPTSVNWRQTNKPHGREPPIYRYGSHPWERIHFISVGTVSCCRFHPGLAGGQVKHAFRQSLRGDGAFEFLARLRGSSPHARQTRGSGV